jgi:hypothetical protein
VVLLLAGVLAAGAFPVQGAEGEGAPSRVSAEELADFAAVVRQIRRMRAAEKVPVSGRVRDRMVEAVKAQGLTVERYNTLARRIREDEALYRRYQKAWNRLREGD